LGHSVENYCIVYFTVIGKNTQLSRVACR